MTVQIKDSSGVTRTVKTADDIIDALTAQATPTSVKGSPTTQMMTVQGGNEYLDLGTNTLAYNGSGALFQHTKAPGLIFECLVVSIEALATSASVTVRGRNSANEAWSTLRLQQAASSQLTGSISLGGLFYTYVPFKYIEVIHSGGTAGSTTATALLFRRPPPVREVQAFIAVSRTTNAVQAAGNPSQPTMTTYGALITKPYSIPEADWTYSAASGGITNTTDVALVAAGAAGIRNYLTGLDIVNTHASVDTEVVVKDGSTVIWRRKVKAGASLSVQFRTPLKGTAATAMNAACITTGAEVYINAQGYQAQ